VVVAAAVVAVDQAAVRVDRKAHCRNGKGPDAMSGPFSLFDVSKHPSRGGYSITCRPAPDRG
jgi:hypothetical protein